MKLLKAFLGISFIGLVCVVIAGHVSPRFFVKAAYAFVKYEFTSLPDIPSQAILNLSRNQRGDYIVVDVRSPAEREVSKIEGSIDQVHFERNIDAYQKKKVIVYCTIGYRSGFYAKTLLQQGLDVYNLREGILGWIQSGGLLVNTEGQVTPKVHVYSRPWDLGVKDHIAVY